MTKVYIYEIAVTTYADAPPGVVGVTFDPDTATYKTRACAETEEEALCKIRKWVEWAIFTPNAAPVWDSDRRGHGVIPCLGFEYRYDISIARV